MADQDQVVSYELLLGRQQFDEEMGKKGLALEKIEEYWEKLKLFFDLSMMQMACETLSVEEQNKLVGRTSPYSDQEEIKAFIERVRVYLRENPVKLDLSKHIEKSIVKAYSELGEMMKEGK